MIICAFANYILKPRTHADNTQILNSLAFLIINIKIIHPVYQLSTMKYQRVLNVP